MEALLSVETDALRTNRKELVTMIPESSDVDKRNCMNDPAGLIVPRKPQNPCLESRGHKDLHRELLFNQKIGKNVLGQKSELQRALEKHKEQQVKKESVQMKEESQLERIIHERAKRLETQDNPVAVEETPGTEFLQVHAKLRGRMNSK